MRRLPYKSTAELIDHDDVAFKPVKMSDMSPVVKATIDAINNVEDSAAFHPASDFAVPSDIVPQVQPDWNAGSGLGRILNKPTLGSAAAQNTSAFATSAQGVEADTALQSVDLSGLVTKTTTVNGHALSTNVTVSKSDVGLGSVDNTAGNGNGI